MADYNIGICENDVPNQGYGDCITELAPLTRVIRLQPKEYIPASFWATPEASVIAKLIHDDPAVRWFASPRFNDTTEAVQETATATAADGSIFTLKEGSSTYSFLLNETNDCAQKAIRGFDGTKNPFLLYQSNKVFTGLKSYALTSPFALQMGGYRPQRVYVPKATLRMNTATANSTLMMNFIDPKGDEARKVTIAAPDVDWDTLFDEYRVTNAKIVLTAEPTVTGVVKFKIVSGCGNANLVEAYGTDWVASLFTFFTAAGASLAKTISVNTTTHEITMTATTPPASGTILIIGLAAVSVLAAAGIEYYETPAHRLDGTINPLSYKLNVENF